MAEEKSEGVLCGQPAERLDAGGLYLRSSGDPTLAGTTLGLPLGRRARTLINLWERADVAESIGELRQVIKDTIALMYEDLSANA